MEQNGTTSLATETVTVSISMQQPVSFQIPWFVNIDGTIYRINRAIFEQPTDPEPTSFEIQYALCEPGNAAVYNIPANRLYEGIGVIPAKRVAMAIHEARTKPHPERVSTDSVFTAPHD